MIGQGVPAAGHCSEHPGRAASFFCSRCGSFACGDCVVDTLWGESACEGCARRGRLRYPLAWERSLSPGAWLSTTRAILLDARVLFTHFPEASAVRALGYALLWLVPLLCASALGVTLTGIASGHGARTSGLAGALLVQAVTHVFWTLATAGSYFAVMRAFGARIRLGQAVAVSAYVSAFGALTATLMNLPLLGGWLSAPLWLLRLYFAAWAWSLHARSGLGLTRNKAIAVALLTFAGGACAAFFVVVAVAVAGAFVSGAV